MQVANVRHVAHAKRCRIIFCRPHSGFPTAAEGGSDMAEQDKVRQKQSEAVWNGQMYRCRDGY